MTRIQRRHRRHRRHRRDRGEMFFSLRPPGALRSMRSHEARRLFAAAAGTRRMAGDDRDLQARRRLPLHNRERRPRRPLCARRRSDARRSRAGRHREGDASPCTDAQVRSLKFEVRSTEVLQYFVLRTSDFELLTSNFSMPAVTPTLALIIFAAGAVAGSTAALLALGGGVFLVPFLTLGLGLPVALAA